eukprot:scaffold9114_cov118-Isochrysis_galbana.AAC.19
MSLADRSRAIARLRSRSAGEDKEGCAAVGSPAGRKGEGCWAMRRVCHDPFLRRDLRALARARGPIVRCCKGCVRTGFEAGDPHARRLARWERRVRTAEGVAGGGDGATDLERGV